jgi:hypothetical protein
MDFRIAPIIGWDNPPETQLPSMIVPAPDVIDLCDSDESDASTEDEVDVANEHAVDYEAGGISISDALDAVALSNMGDFATFNPTSHVDPELHVPSIGKINLPLTGLQALQLAGICRHAPFGNGSQTTVDLNVRDTWELNADQFEIKNPAWDRYVDDLTKTAVQELGVTNGDTIKPELYKLLLYGPGAHFHKHKEYDITYGCIKLALTADSTEKANGMFATLVISLPSPHKGGGVVLNHNKQTKVFSTSKADQSYLCW